MHMPVQVITYPSRNRKGRKRKSGKRYASGDIIIDRGEDVVSIAIAHPDRQCLPEDARLDQRAGTPLGRLCLRRIITPFQLEAGRKYAGDARRYQQAIGAPSPNAPSLDLMRGDRSNPEALKPEEIQLRQENYNDAFEAVYDVGHKAARAVARVAVYDEWLPAGTTIEDLKRGLTALVKFYGLTTKAKSSYLGNRD